MQKVRDFLQAHKRSLIIASIAVVFIGLVIVFYLVASSLIGNSSNSANTSGNNEEGSSETSGEQNSGSGGQGLSGDVKGLIGSVASTRNLKGLTLRINQIDTCSLPNADAYVAVTNGDGDVIRSLKKEEITVTVDGKKIDSFIFDPINDEERSLASTLVIDKSGSMAGAPMNDAHSAARSYVKSSGSKDTFALIAFDSQVHTLQGRTKDKQSIMNSIGGIAAGGNTAIYDAVSVAVDNTSGCGRKAVVLMSDGDDTASTSFNIDQAINKANLAGLPVFTVGLKGTNFSAGPLRSIAERTGGQYFETSNSAELASLYAKISNQLKGQYYVGLKLVGVPKNGKEHVLKITSNIAGSPTTSERHFIY